MASRIEHSGVVECTERDAVCVKIVSHSACGTCRARQACGMAETEQKTVRVVTPEAAQYAPGDAVSVGVMRRVGGLAVLLAYVGALVVLLLVLVLTTLLGWSEGLCALASVGGVVAYYGVLWLFRRKIEHTIQFTITKI